MSRQKKRQPKPREPELIDWKIVRMRYLKRGLLGVVALIDSMRRKRRTRIVTQVAFDARGFTTEEYARITAIMGEVPELHIGDDTPLHVVEHLSFVDVHRTPARRLRVLDELCAAIAARRPGTMIHTVPRGTLH